MILAVFVLFTNATLLLDFYFTELLSDSYVFLSLNLYILFLIFIYERPKSVSLMCPHLSMTIFSGFKSL
jgi:hypothetical protein